MPSQLLDIENGFRSFHLDDELELHRPVLQRRSPVELKAIEVYHKKTERLSVFGVEAHDIEYIFSNGRLCTVAIYFVGQGINDRILAAFEERYGKPTEPSAIPGNHIWAGQKVVLSIREAMAGNEEARVHSTLDYARVHLGSVK